MNRLILFGLTCLLSGIAQAQSPTPAPASRPAAIKCQSGTPQGELACLVPDLKELEAAVDRQISQLGKKLRLNERTKHSRAVAELRASQASWRQFRNQHCVIETLAGSDQTEWLQVRTHECAMRLTKDRLESLRDIEATLE
jgi:uncharacterized protein YecT (DUF1311 family)